MVDKLFFVILVLNATGLFSFLAPQVGLSISHITLALLIFNILYLLARSRHACGVLLSSGMRPWLILLLLWPFLTLAYAPSTEFREIGLQFYFFTLLLGAVSYTVANGLPAMRRVLCTSLIVTAAGLVLSMVAPHYFIAVAELAGASSFERESRACGFLLQPNSLANTLCFLFVGWFALWDSRSVLFQVAAILCFLTLMLLTGSRTGMLVAVLVTALIFVPSSNANRPNIKRCVTAMLLIVCLGFSGVVLKDYILDLQNAGTQREDLINRIETILSFRLSDDGGIRDDGSIRHRLAAQAVYRSLIEERPILGHGVGSEASYLKNGVLFLSAHSQAVSSALQYGLLYPLGVIALFIGMYLKRSRRAAERILQGNCVGQFVSVLLVLFLVNGDLLDSRTYYVVWGMFFTVLHFPRTVFSIDARTGRETGILYRRVRPARLAPVRSAPKRPSLVMPLKQAAIQHKGASQ